MLRISNLTGFNSLVPTASGCLPYQVDEFPFTTYWPTDTDLTSYDSYFFDNPSQDGVSLNLNLGGWAPSWENNGSEPAYQGVYTFLYDPYYASVDGGVVGIYEGYPVYIRTDYTGSFDILNNAAAYDAIGGSEDGTYNPAPGHHVYPGVASFNSWSSFVQAKNYGEPIIFELWYSLNNSRVDRTKGYSNYTFFGPGNAPLPWIWLGYYSDPYGTTRKVRKYQGGILKVDADMNNLQESDFVCGVSYIDNGSGATVKLIKKGVVVASDTAASTNRLRGYVHCDYNDELSYFGNNKAFVDFFEIAYGSNYLYNGSAWPYDSADFFDTYHVKWAWIVDCETSGNPYDDVIFASAGAIAMYTMPNFNLPCDPGITLPGYIPPAPVTP